MSDVTTADDRKRAEAFGALALPVRDVNGTETEREVSPALEIHDGDVFADDPGSEDILEGLDQPEGEGYRP